VAYYFAPRLIVRFVVQAAVEAGLSRTRLLSAAGISAEELSDAEVFLPLEKLTATLQQAIRLTGDDAFALGIIHGRKPEEFDILALAAYSQATCRDVVERSIEALNAGFNCFRQRLELEEGRAVWLTELEIPYTGSLRPLLELLCSIKQVVVWCAAGQVRVPLHVGFQYPRPAHGPEYGQFFRAPLHFDHPRCEYAFPAEWLAAPCVYATPTMRPVLERYAEFFLRAFPGRTHSLAERVGELIVRHMAEAPPTVDSMASRLGLRPRTLQYRLRREGFSFFAILDGRRRELARLYLAEGGKSVTDVALALGFNDTTSFGRAFRKWYGTTPKEFRSGASVAGRRTGGLSDTESRPSSARKVLSSRNLSRQVGGPGDHNEWAVSATVGAAGRRMRSADKSR
jgi:AraC-like DNA-binding protein